MPNKIIPIMKLKLEKKKVFLVGIIKFLKHITASTDKKKKKQNYSETNGNKITTNKWKKNYFRLCQ